MADLIAEARWEPEQQGPRVLVEAADWSTRQALGQILQAAGYRSVSCPGPSGADSRCPLAAGAGCGAAEEADVVVHALHAGDPRNREVLRAFRQRLPDTPLVVEVPERTVAAHPEDYEDCIVVHPPMTSDALLHAVGKARGLGDLRRSVRGRLTD